MGWAWITVSELIVSMSSPCVKCNYYATTSSKWHYVFVTNYRTIFTDLCTNTVIVPKKNKRKSKIIFWSLFSEQHTIILYMVITLRWPRRERRCPKQVLYNEPKFSTVLTEILLFIILSDIIVNKSEWQWIWLVSH